MSNEKPVRITVGDVKEVAEATTIQTEMSDAKPASSVSYTASVPNNSGYGMVYLAGIAGFILLVIAGYFGLVKGVTPNAVAPTNNAPVVSVPVNADANNATKAATNVPAETSAAPSANNTASDTNSAPDTNVAANNAPAK